MDVNQTFRSHSEIRIVVFPVGDIPSHKYKHYVEFIKNHDKCELMELSAANVYVSGTLLFTL